MHEAYISISLILQHTESSSWNGYNALLVQVQCNNNLFGSAELQLGCHWLVGKHNPIQIKMSLLPRLRM